MTARLSRLLDYLSTAGMSRLVRHDDEHCPHMIEAEAQTARLAEALDELWGLLPVGRLSQVSEQTKRVARANHDRMWH
jgi:hypothetical protein